MNRMIQHLLATRGGDEVTDGELLTRFLSGRDSTAYAELVRRHAPLVWGVCSRILRNHDAEDAFQATFLVLVQKAATLPNRETVGHWLYGVAGQTAVRMRSLAAKRGMRERQVTNLPEPSTAEEYVWNDLVPVLDQEVGRLPHKYRVLIVMCDLEGITRKDVARQLNIPEGTVASRLATARTMLAKRLSRRGVVVSGVLLGTMLSTHSTTASVPVAVIGSTIKTATMVSEGQVTAVSPTVAALITEVTKAMLMTKIKSVLAVVLVVAICFGGAGVGFLKWPMAAAQQPGPEKQAPPAAASASTDNKDASALPVPARKGELAAIEQKLVGTWIGTGPCVGRTVFQADGTYHQCGYGPGGGHFEVGTWKIEWNELPPLLVFKPFTTDSKEPVDPNEGKYYLVKLNDKHLDFRWSKHADSRIEEHRRGSDLDNVAVRIEILDSAVQIYLGTKKLGGSVNLPPNLKTLVDTQVLSSPKSLLDPWGKGFQYDIAGKKTANKEVPDIWTEMPDKSIIGNWSKRGK